MLKLNLGCGKKKFDGYENIDLPTDIRALPYAPGSCSEIVAIHVFEHLYRHDAVKALRHWLDLLAPGGTLILEMPCLEKILQHFGTTSTPNLTTWGLYGEQAEVALGNTAMQHLWCWSHSELISEMLAAGFTTISSETPKFHKPQRDMRIIGRKP